MENLIKKDPLTGKEFIAKRANQRFASTENKIRFHNRKNAELYKIRSPYEKRSKHSHLAIIALYNPKSENKFHVEYLKGKGVDLGAFNHVINKPSGDLFCYYDFALKKTNNPDILQIVKL
jgi:hypothetical protein